MAEKGMKIALVITRMDRGGAPDIVMGLFDHLESRGHDVRLITGLTVSPSKAAEVFMKKHNNSIYIIPELKRDPHPVSDIAALIKLFYLFKREKFDVVHTHTAKAGFIGRIAARLSGVKKVIHTPHGHNFYGYFGSIASALVIFLEKAASMFADKIMVFTDVEKTDMMIRNICDPCKIVVVRSGVELKRYEKAPVDIEARKKELGISAAELAVGMISRLDDVKGPEYFIESIRYIADALPGVKFLVVGDGPLKERLVSRSRALGLEKNIIFTGWREDIDDILSVLDVVVLTSLNEAVGRVLLEAGASAKPVVATDVGGIPEVLNNDVTGLLVPPRDAKRTAEAVITLLNDGQKRARMGQAARAWVRENFDEDKMFNKIQDLYREPVTS